VQSVAVLALAVLPDRQLEPSAHRKVEIQLEIWVSNGASAGELT
jgi:hypothetical protein